MHDKTTYELYARAPSRRGRRPLRYIASWSERRWQFALKAREHLKEKGFSDCVVREVQVTHEER